MQTHYFSSGDRGIKDIGWLKSNFTFSFSDYAHPMKSAFGTLITFNDDYVAPGKGFGIHPHVNMEIISVLLKGKMNHKDSMNYSTEIGEGGVQIMSAGTGLFHEEYNIGDDEVNFLQIWIQPKQQNIKPRYQLRHFPLAQRKNSLKTIISGEEGQEHCWINQNARLSLGHYDAGQHVTYPYRSLNKCLFIFLIQGSIRIGDTTLQPKDALGIWDTETATIESLEESQFIIIETVVNQK